MWIFKLLFWIVLLICLGYLGWLTWASWTISANVGVIFTAFTICVTLFLLLMIAISSKGTND